MCSCGKVFWLSSLSLCHFFILHSMSFTENAHCKVWYIFSCNSGICICFTQKVILNRIALVVHGMFEIKLVGDNTHYEFLGLDNYLGRTLVNVKNTKFRNCPHTKKVPIERKRGNKMWNPSTQEKKEELISRQQKKCWLLKLMENLSIWKNPGGVTGTCWIFIWICSNACFLRTVINWG